MRDFRDGALASLGPSLFLLALLTLVDGLAVGAEKEIKYADSITGLERFLPEAIKAEVVYTAEIFSNASGGKQQGGRYLDNLDLQLTLDAEELLGWDGITIFLYGLGNNGGNPNQDLVGSVQGVSNIEAFSTFKLYEAWLEKRLADDRLSLRFGLYDLNSEFDVIKTAGLFLNPSHGIGADYAQSGENGPSIFPTTSLGARVKLQPSGSLYLQVALLDGVPGSLENERGTHIHFGSGDGLLVAAEFAYFGSALQADESDGKIAVGSWLYTSEFDDLLETGPSGKPIPRRGNRGFYALSERTVFREKDDSSQNLSLFARFGVANAHVNQTASYLGAGAVYTGLLPGRDEDQIGFAFAQARNGGDFEEAQMNLGQSGPSSETALEFSYRVRVLPWLAVQPDVQFLINPGTDPSLKNALVFGTRIVVSF